MRIRKAAEVAVEQCRYCIARLRQQRPHLAADAQPGVPAHHEEMAVLLTTALTTMQGCVASQPDAEPDDALDAVNEALIQFDQTRGLGDMPLPGEFVFDLLRIRAAICAHQDGIDWVESDDAPPVLPAREAEPDWDRQRSVLDLVQSLLVQVGNLSLHPQLLDRAAGADITKGTTGVLLNDMQTRLQDMIRELQNRPANFEHLVRLASGLWVAFMMYELLDPNARTWDIKGAIATLRGTILEAKEDPSASVVN